MLEFIILIRPLFSPKTYVVNLRLLLSHCLLRGQLSMANVRQQLAYHYQWQHMYHFVTILPTKQARFCCWL